MSNNTITAFPGIIEDIERTKTLLDKIAAQWEQTRTDQQKQRTVTKETVAALERIRRELAAACRLSREALAAAHQQLDTIHQLQQQTLPRLSKDSQRLSQQIRQTLTEHKQIRQALAKHDQGVLPQLKTLMDDQRQFIQQMLLALWEKLNERSTALDRTVALLEQERREHAALRARVADLPKRVRRQLGEYTS